MRRSILLAIALFAVAGCSQRGLGSRLQVDAKTAEGVDMSSYKTWNFARPDSTQSGIALLDDAEFRVKALDAIEKDMAARGLVRVHDDSPDLKLMMHVATEQKVDEIAAANPEFDFASLPDGTVWQTGSLHLLLFDARTAQMVWQGNAEAELDELAGDRTRQQRFIDVVGSLIEQIPMGGSPVSAR